MWPARIAVVRGQWPIGLWEGGPAQLDLTVTRKVADLQERVGIPGSSRQPQSRDHTNRMVWSWRADESAWRETVTRQDDRPCVSAQGRRMMHPSIATIVECERPREIRWPSPSTHRASGLRAAALREMAWHFARDRSRSSSSDGQRRLPGKAVNSQSQPQPQPQPQP